MSNNQQFTPILPNPSGVTMADRSPVRHLLHLGALEHCRRVLAPISGRCDVALCTTFANKSQHYFLHIFYTPPIKFFTHDKTANY